MNELRAWAERWQIPDEALVELGRTLYDPRPDPELTGGTETPVQNQLRLRASAAGWRLFRNNNGAAKTDTGSWVRFGLANDSEAVSKRIKSSDLIGIRPRVIQPQDVGRTIGQFVAREVKRPGWTFQGYPRENAQMNFITLIQTLGGDARFTTGEL